jgi:hypothetical protein
VQLSVPAPVIEPLAQLNEDRVAVGAGTASCRAKLFVTPLALAVNVAVCAALTVVTEAEKLALLAPAATVTEAGMVTDELLLARLTVKPPVGAAALSVTVQLSVPAPVIDPLAQLNEDRFVVLVVLAAVPVALSPIILPPQPDRVNGRQHETRRRRNARQRQDSTTCARKSASHRFVLYRWQGDSLAVVKLHPYEVQKGMSNKCITR